MVLQMHIGDTYRHCTGVGQLARTTSGPTAKAVGVAYEVKTWSRNTPEQRGMDLHNNNVGASIGRDASSFEELEQGCRSALDNGELVAIR